MTTENLQKNASREAPVSTLLTGEELSKYQKYIANVQELVFTVGFNRSGSSLIGDLLDGHPNIVIANEAGVIRKYIQGKITSRESLLALIIKNSMNKARKNFIAGQNCYDSATVIGDKHSPNNTLALMEEGFNTLEKLNKLVKLPIKFLFTVRNPYDMISSMIIKVYDCSINEAESFEKAISYFTKCSKKNLELIKQVPSDKIFMIRHEDLVASPEKMLRDICDFLDVSQIPGHPSGRVAASSKKMLKAICDFGSGAQASDYLSDCVKAIYKMPNKSRDSLDWDAEHKTQVDALIEKYEFFNGYNWDK